MATIDMTRPTHAERGNGWWSFLLCGAIIALMVVGLALKASA